MTKPCSKLLRPNPFTAYRDPVTGEWIVIHAQNQLPTTSFTTYREETGEWTVVQNVASNN